MNDLANISTYSSVRPDILIDDEFQTALNDRVNALVIEETTEGLFRCEITAVNWGPVDGSGGYLYFKRDILDFGKTISVRMGSDETAATIFNGRIMALEARFPHTRAPEITILAEDRFQDLRMTRRTRAFEDVSDSDVFNLIASEHGLQADLDIDGPSYSILTQLNQSNLAFLRERARAIDAEIWLENSTLHAQMRNRRETGAITLTCRQRLLELSLCVDLSCQQSSYFVSGWDIGAKEAIEHEATDSVLGNEVNGGLTGSSVLQSALGKRSQSLVHTVPLSSAEAQAVAEAEFRQYARKFVSGWAISEGDGRLRVGTHVNLQGIGDLLNGEYYITHIRHVFDLKSGYRCKFRVERAEINQV